MCPPGVIPLVRSQGGIGGETGLRLGLGSIHPWARSTEVVYSVRSELDGAGGTSLRLLTYRPIHERERDLFFFSAL